MQKTILDFWFTEISRKQCWVKDDAFDALIRVRLAALHAQVNRCELFA